MNNQEHPRRGFTQNRKLFSVPLAGKVREAGKGGVEKKSLFNNPPSAFWATSPARGEANGGFTLIELLVVVLIIGILVAVALPQYNKAVIKSRFAEAKINLKTFAQALQLCTLAEQGFHGECFLSDIEEPELGTPHPVGRETDNFVYHGYALLDGSVEVDAGSKKDAGCLCFFPTTDEWILGRNLCVEYDPNDEYYENLLGLTTDASRCSCC